MGAPRGKRDASGLGRAIQNTVRKESVARKAGIALPEPESVNLRSITEEKSLEEFISTANLAEQDFETERSKEIRLVHLGEDSSTQFSESSQKNFCSNRREWDNFLRIPRRPRWDASTTPQQLDKMERDAFLEWRRGIASVQENSGLVMTPFERNILMWKQLWRVIERSDIVIQIVDARNPLLFRCPDLEQYVLSVGANKQNLLLVNKADLLSKEQRTIWQNFFRVNGIDALFFSAKLASTETDEKEVLSVPGNVSSKQDQNKDHDQQDGQTQQDNHIQQNDRTQQNDHTQHSYLNQQDDYDQGRLQGATSEADTSILTIADLTTVIESRMEQAGADRIVVGLVGYPNVGKSSTINAILSAKKVSVSATPGKTKHFQTLKMTERITLCDCPGLVFPNFSSTKAELILNGVLPIDQMREHRNPIQLLTMRVPKKVLEQEYNTSLPAATAEQTIGSLSGSKSEHHASALCNSDAMTSPDALLDTYATSRGFHTSGRGGPDQARAARYILKDYVNARLVFCLPPPSFAGSELEFHKLGISRARYKEITDNNSNNASSADGGVHFSSGITDSANTSAAMSLLRRTVDGASSGYSLIDGLQGQRGRQKHRQASSKKHGKGRKFHGQVAL